MRWTHDLENGGLIFDMRKNASAKMLRWLLLAMAAAFCLTMLALPAAAEEGGDEVYSDIAPSGDEEPPAEEPPEEEPPSSEPGGEEPGPGGEDPTPEPGGEDPTPEPGDGEPTPEPGGEDSTPEPGDGPNSSEPGEWEEPDEPWTPPEETGGTSSSQASSAPARVPGGTGGTIRQPSFSPSSATPTPAPSATPVPGSTEPNYRTFARLTQKNNSMSVVLFYGGASFVGVGSLGLITLAVFIFRGRRNTDERDGIFEEIHEAENRRPAARRPQPPRPREPQPPEPVYEYEPGYEERPPVLHRPEPEALSVPVNGSMYTEEFELPQPARQAPPQASMYTEEFVLPEEMAQPPRPEPAPAPTRPAPRPVRPQPLEPMSQEPMAHEPPPQALQQPQPPRPAAPQPASPPASDPHQYDTVELLREILHGGEDQ